DGKKWMRQMRRTEQAGSVRCAANCVNRLMLKQKQFVFQRAVLAFLGKEFFLQYERVGKIHSAKPTHAKIWRAELLRRQRRFARHRLRLGLAGARPSIHICAPLGTPKRAASCERRCVKPIASASAASASGVSVKPRSARTMNAT